MGNGLTSCCQQPAEEPKDAVASPAYESTTYPAQPAEPNQVYEQVVDEIKDAAVEIKDAVEAKVDEIKDAAVEIKDAVDAKADETTETVEEVVVETAKAENATDTQLVVVVEEDQTTPAKPEEGNEIVEEALEKDVEKDVKEPGVTPLEVVFELKGVRKTAKFTHNVLGFEYSQGSTGCCSSATFVKVTKVTPNGQAKLAGMEPKAIIRQVDGKDIADLKQMQGLVENHRATLPLPEASN